MDTKIQIKDEKKKEAKIQMKLDENFLHKNHYENKDLIELFQNLLTCVECSICKEIMHLPFTIKCGHTFCYDCLCLWFENKTNCPTCRSKTECVPILNLQLKDVSKNIMDLFIKNKKDENEKKQIISMIKLAYTNYKNDKKSNSFFGNIFNLALILRDESDGVSRCLKCNWEAFGSSCFHCGSKFRNSFSSDQSDSQEGFENSSTVSFGFDGFDSDQSISVQLSDGSQIKSDYDICYSSSSSTKSSNISDDSQLDSSSS